MDTQERAQKDLDKLRSILGEFKQLGLGKKYPAVLDWAANYFSDAQHFFEQGDFFSAFGAANYAYGIIDAALIIEKKK